MAALKELDIYLIDFRPVCKKETSFCDYLCGFLAYYVLSEKGSTLKGKNLLQRGANSFLLEKSHFRKE